MKIDIERLIDAELEEMDSQYAYYYFGKNQYKNFPDYDKRKEVGRSVYNDNNHARWQIMAIMEVLNIYYCSDNGWKNLYISARAVRKWRERNEYRLIPSDMKDQIGRFIFGKEYDA